MKKTVMITGASRGIGKGIALACAKAGYNLIITCSNSQAQLEAVKDTCSQYGSTCLAYVGDMGDVTCVSELMKQISLQFSGVDILVNNAGISKMGLLTDLSHEDWDKLISTNLSSVFHCSKGVIPYMVSQKSGKIINISSIWGVVGASCEVAYATTKGGMNAFTKSLAKELAPSNIQVNGLALGLIDTAMNDVLDREEKQAFIEEIPTGRMGSVEEVAHFVMGLMEGHEYMTGQIITFDGGLI